MNTQSILLWAAVLVTILMVAMMFRPGERSGEWDIGWILRLMWLIPISGTWVIYFAAMHFFF